MYVEQAIRIGPASLARLVAVAGRLDLASGPGGSRMAADCRALVAPDLFDVLRGTWTYATVVALYPSSQLVGHRDPPCRGTRHHLPLVVNPGCWVFHAGTWQQLEPGRCYTMDPTEVHGAVNWGDAVRWHLVVDVEG